MPRVDLILESDVVRTPRVIQMEGIFDVPAEEKTRVEFHFDAPLEEKPWSVGLIVGPSGAGKTSVARELFGEALEQGFTWPSDRAVVDGFGELPIREITGALSSVGFSSPPNWVRRYDVLSNGEKFRANMARALVDQRQLIVVDEFTSVVDRQVAKVGSHALAKAVRARPGKQFVAVSCHYDIEEWLQPDWVLEPHLGQFAWRSLRRRPSVELEVGRCGHEAWGRFAAHHYLSAELHRNARCFIGYVDGTPACFAALLFFPHPRVRDIQSLSRIVVLPDFQGLGLGAYSFVEAIGKICAANGFRMSTHPSHPALVKAWSKMPDTWLCTKGQDFGVKVGKTSSAATIMKTAVRRVAHFSYIGKGFETDRELRTARTMWNATTTRSRLRTSRSTA